MKTTAILGLLVAVLPFLGIPVFYKTIIFTIAGLLIFGQSFCRGKNDCAPNNNEKPQNSVFVENGDCSNSNEER